MTILSRVIIALILLSSVAAAYAQTLDPVAAVYEQLLTQANRTIAILGAKVQTAETENARLKAQIDKMAAPSSEGKAP